MLVHGRQRAQAHSRPDLIERWRVSFALDEVGNEVVDFALPLCEGHTRISVAKKRRIVNEKFAKLGSSRTKLDIAPKKQKQILAQMNADLRINADFLERMNGDGF